ncbi:MULTISPECIES: RES family NAD+ phosphorylase [Alphaproteobacteria]|uniref:RES domain-containing protein n=1 Tax=Maricaulis virginensis TaxID=144022 RepID=A0A9W6MQF3_9PROT|nr:RES domain-containing protein [Maricaulis virginensis]GLK53954.1 hypothetical protein GCM10017621_34620 [Maricaulis virginensis]
MSNHRQLPEHRTLYRIGDPSGEYPIFSPGGAMKVPGRWHDQGDRVIYAAEHYSTAMLEKLVHSSGVLPPNQHWIDIHVPAGVTYERVTGDVLPNWQDADCQVAQKFGHDWYSKKSSCLLFVPSVVARMEENVIINTDHLDFTKLKPGLETPVPWDRRLFDR